MIANTQLGSLEMNVIGDWLFEKETGHDSE